MNDPQSSGFAERLEHLFRTVYPADRGPYNNEEVADAVSAQGDSISASYLWLLRTGRRDNPTMKHLQTLARFFGVPAAYFFDDDTHTQISAELETLAVLRDAGVRKVAMRTLGISAGGLANITSIVDQIRQIEGLGEPKNR